mmetsp:Transcript_28457/g.67758  ORF Transcript_28457/g.67758 Transcript_28457/m.67758 type:complete len:251 (+) Transcript_28457:320-1072(+)
MVAVEPHEGQCSVGEQAGGGDEAVGEGVRACKGRQCGEQHRAGDLRPEAADGPLTQGPVLEILKREAPGAEGCPAGAGLGEGDGHDNPMPELQAEKAQDPVLVEEEDGRLVGRDASRQHQQLQKHAEQQRADAHKDCKDPRRHQRELGPAEDRGGSGADVSDVDHRPQSLAGAPGEEEPVEPREPGVEVVPTAREPGEPERRSAGSDGHHEREAVRGEQRAGSEGGTRRVPQPEGLPLRPVDSSGARTGL